MKNFFAEVRLIQFLKIICFVAAINLPTPLFAASTFRFIVWADTKTGLSEFSALSSQVKAKHPLMTFYPGDLCESGATPQVHRGDRSRGPGSDRDFCLKRSIGAGDSQSPSYPIHAFPIVSHCTI